MERNLQEPRRPVMEQASGGEERGNPTEDNRKAVRRAMENIENNTPSLTQDLARVRVMKTLQFKGINSKLGGFPEYSSPVPETAPQQPNLATVPSQTDDTDPGGSLPSLTTRYESGSDDVAEGTPDPASNNVPAFPAGEGTCQLLPECEVHPTKLLGRGSYATVWEFEYKGKKYAAKKYNFDPQSSDFLNFRSFTRDHEVLGRSSHKNIVSYYGICTLVDQASTKSLVIAMERMEKALSTYLKEEKKISLPTKFRILHDVASGLHHLHIHGIIHRDLTANNVLLTYDGTDEVAKIGDFGNSRIVDLSKLAPLTSKPGTIDYMPPEALEGGDYDEKLDIFSYAHLGIYIFIQESPHSLLAHNYKKAGKFIPRTEVERREKHLKKVRLQLRGGDRHPFYIMLTECLDNEAEERPGCKKVLECIEQTN